MLSADYKTKELTTLYVAKKLKSHMEWLYGASFSSRVTLGLPSTFSESTMDQSIFLAKPCYARHKHYSKV